jgi:glycosyltransferase involved in cell wall biosynthesis
MALSPGDGAPEVSVVVPTRERPERLAALLAALRAQTLAPARFEVIVVDDASTDSTPSLLKREAASSPFRLRMLRRGSSTGPAAARNEGWRGAAGEVIAFTDDDCEPAPEWLAAGLRAARAAPGAVIQGRTEPNPAELRHQGPFSRTLRVTELGPHFETANMFYPRSLLERLGGFDERFRRPGGEDTDLAWRAIEAGAPVEFAAPALVHHAVEDHGPIGMLRVAGRWYDLMYALRRHPGYRARTRWRRIFWKQSHALLAQALIGCALARRFPPAALLALPYLRHLLGRCEQVGAAPAYAPYLALHDLVEVGAAVRGGLRHRVLVI